MSQHVESQDENYEEDTSEGQTTTITIAGLEFKVPSPFHVGYTLKSEGEASAMNQTFHENLRNNFAKRVKDAGEGETAELQAALDEYAQSYQFGVRAGGTRTTDPVRRRALELAEERGHQRSQEEGPRSQGLHGRADR